MLRENKCLIEIFFKERYYTLLLETKHATFAYEKDMPYIIRTMCVRRVSVRVNVRHKKMVCVHEL